MRLYLLRIDRLMAWQSEDSDYERFSSSMTDARRRKAEREAPAPTVDVVVGQLSNSVQGQKDQRGE